MLREGQHALEMYVKISENRANCGRQTLIARYFDKPLFRKSCGDLLKVFRSNLPTSRSIARPERFSKLREVIAKTFC